MWIPNTAMTGNLRRQKCAEVQIVLDRVSLAILHKFSCQHLRALRLIAMLYYKKNVSMRKPYLLKFNDPRVANHLSQYVLI